MIQEYCNMARKPKFHETPPILLDSNVYVWLDFSSYSILVTGGEEIHRIVKKKHSGKYVFESFKFDILKDAKTKVESTISQLSLF